jgi:hypothetical protein
LSAMVFMRWRSAISALVLTSIGVNILNGPQIG